MTKHVFIKTYGCQMNVYDSERMAESLLPLGYTLTENIEHSSLVVLNTCHIREKATEKVYSEVGRLRRHKEAAAQRGQEMKIAIAGCVAQAEGEEILERAPVVDMVFGPQTYHRLADMVQAVERGQRLVATDFPAEDKYDILSPQRALSQSPGTPPVSAFLSVQEGCDKFCSFCVVPYTRGSEISRPGSQIIAEAESLVARGVREITLLGQNVNAYHGTSPDGRKEWGLGRLIGELSELENLQRLRYTTSHPRDMDDDLIAAHRDCNKLMPYLHLPVQSGSDAILKAMNRQHNRDDYFALIEKIRKSCPDIALSSDFIVGFPGESAQDFEDTLNLVREIGYAQAYSFKYSPRPGTPGAEKDNQLPEEVKSERLQILQGLLRQQQADFNHSKIGTTMPILLEKPGRKKGQLVGRSPWLQSVHIEDEISAVGDMVNVAITHASSHSLTGIIKTSPHTYRNARNHAQQKTA